MNINLWGLILLTFLKAAIDCMTQLANSVDMLPPSATLLQVDQYFEKVLFVEATTPKISRLVFPVYFVDVLSPIAIFYYFVKSNYLLMVNCQKAFQK